MKQLSGRSYSVDLDGELLRRNRRDLRQVNGNDSITKGAAAEAVEEQPGSDASQSPTRPVPAAPNPASVVPDQVPRLEPRQSDRPKQRPVWTKDYQCEWNE